MVAWTQEELNQIAAVEEVDVAPLRGDGSQHRRVTIWLVRAGDDLYVRSAVKGRDAAWYRGVLNTRQGRLWAGRIERDVSFADAEAAVNDEVDAAYRAKYRRYAGRILNSCLSPEARSTTLRVTPRA